MSQSPQSMELTEWQDQWIAANLLSLGYNAWVGYLSAGAGVVVCTTNTPQVGVTGETFSAHYVPRQRLAPFLNAWLAVPDTVILHHHFMSAHILEAADSYDPQRECLLLLESGQQVTFFYLKNLPVPPPAAYQYLCRYWEEVKPQRKVSSEESVGGDRP
ncbi:hypothetical protein [Thermosynechococcus sp.]|uniref:hypothetical protein n=1 Tax=Thermosynechococcus sp. TaxID=2814275 RepID=UPI00391A1AA1